MNRPWHIWTLFAVCLAGVLVAMGLLTVAALARHVDTVTTTYDDREAA